MQKNRILRDALVLIVVNWRVGYGVRIAILLVFTRSKVLSMSMTEQGSDLYLNWILGSNVTHDLFFTNRDVIQSYRAFGISEHSIIVNLWIRRPDDKGILFQKNTWRRSCNDTKTRRQSSLGNLWTRHAAWVTRSPQDRIACLGLIRCIRGIRNRVILSAVCE